MSNGYLLAAEADLAAIREIGEGFGLDVIGVTSLGDHEATGAALASAANVGLVLSTAAASDAAYVRLLQGLAARLLRAQLIVADPDARAAFQFLPAMWPVMSLDEARMRADAITQQRQPAPAPQTADAEPPPAAEPEPPPVTDHAEPEAPAPQPEPETPPPEQRRQERAASDEEEAPLEEAPLEDALSNESVTESDDAPGPGEDRAGPFGGGAHGEDGRSITEAEAPSAADPSPPSSAEPSPAPGAEAPPPAPRAEEPPAPPPQVDEPIAAGPPPSVSAPAPAPAMPAPQAKAPAAPSRAREDAHVGAADVHSSTARHMPSDTRRGETAPADATAFAPKKLRRATPELVRIVIHQPKDLNAVIKAARKIDARTEPTPQGMSIGDVALGSSVGVSLEVRGASCDGTVQRRTWKGDPIDFSFSVEAEQGVKQAVILARVFIDDAQIGVLAFTRNVAGPSKKPASDGDRVRLKRHKRVFLSYSSKDREVVSAIATAYERAGVEHFWDRASLKSGEEWSPRLRKEIERSDLFHLCWSKSAAQSQWVQKEAEHALTRRKRNSGRPDITVQMLDGPPWARHPASLDSINFDDFVRAAIVGYARGDAD